VILGATGLGEGKIVDALEKLLDLKMLEEREEDGVLRYRFCNKLTREVVYNSYSRAQRRLMHMRVGESIEKVFKDRIDQVIFPLAFHFSMTADLPKILDYSKRAGDRALATFALHEARNFYEKSLDVLTKIDSLDGADAIEAALLVKLGKVNNLLGDWKEALNHFKEAYKLCNEGSKERAEASMAIGEVQMARGLRQEATDWFNRAIGIFENVGDAGGVAESYLGLAWIHWKGGDRKKVLECAERTIEEAERIGNNRLVGKAYLTLGNVHSELTDYHDTGLDYMKKALERFDPVLDLDQIIRVHNNLGSVLTNLGRFDEAMEHLETCLGKSRETGNVNFEGMAIANMAHVRLKTGDRKEASKLFDEALRIFEKVEENYMIAIVYYHKGQIAREDGDLNTAETFLNIALADLEDLDFPIGKAFTMLEYGLLLKDRKKFEEGRKYLEGALVILKVLGHRECIERAERELKEMDG
jgi:tetratricopeptide (TPR) repeat protein